MEFSLFDLLGEPPFLPGYSLGKYKNVGISLPKGKK
jgi:hypothetical protein